MRRTNDDLPVADEIVMTAIVWWLFSSWLLSSLSISAAAHIRGRNAVGWFLVAIIISPLAAAFFVLTVPRLDAGGAPLENHSDPAPIFETSGVHAGLAYRVNADETVDSITAAGATVHFRRMDEFTAFAECQPGPYLG